MAARIRHPQPQVQYIKTIVESMFMQQVKRGHGETESFSEKSFAICSFGGFSSRRKIGENGLPGNDANLVVKQPSTAHPDPSRDSENFKKSTATAEAALKDTDHVAQPDKLSSQEERSKERSLSSSCRMQLQEDNCITAYCKTELTCNPA